MKSFYILEVKWLPITMTKPTRIKVSCKGTSVIFSKEALENDANDLNNNPIHSGERVTIEDLAAYRFVSDVIIKKWNPMEGGSIHVIGKGEGANGHLNYVVGR